MTEYRVRWEIDVEADSVREAAEKARASQIRPDTLATVFDVENPEEPLEFFRIDVLDPEEDGHRNRHARDGVDRCHCGNKYWQNDRCIDCGTHISGVQRDD